MSPGRGGWLTGFAPEPDRAAIISHNPLTVSDFPVPTLNTLPGAEEDFAAEINA